MTSARTRDRLVQRLTEQGIGDQRVLDRIRNVPRHLFMDEALAIRAYEDTALPIGFGQTISQPYVVARMTEALLGAGPSPNVLEIGTGCGYQTAVLSPLVPRGLQHRADRTLLAQRAAYAARAATSATCASGSTTAARMARSCAVRRDPGHGRAASPFRCAHRPAREVGGRLIAPVGPEGRQELMRFTKLENRLLKQALGAVSFVPLLSGLQR